MDTATHLARCPRCGATLPRDTPDSSCPACLFAVAASPASALTGEGPTSLAVSRGTSQEPPQLTPGQSFGPYCIGRILGRGGMGDVYEADEREQGRRVALKVLNRRLNGPQDRARFLREGQLAASINHPHTVYIFGSEEIAGTPTIVMELLPGGTLKDRVKAYGPLPPAEAVDAILQVIAGLDAMHAAGVLHRDIKPANCFVDGDGIVKVGDFGLSISTLAWDVRLTASGTFHGTPQFASPEQLKGDPLDVRADIYAVGATLYYLLSGRPPFDDTDVLALVTRIATDAPPSPRTITPGVPRSLAAVVLRCVAKDRAQRPATYAALHDALRPFSSAAPTPATIGMRCAAGAIDQFVVETPLTLLTWLLIAGDFPWARPWWLFIVPLAMGMAYYGLTEGLLGASIGKRLVRLQVVIASGGQPPGLTRAACRALLFHTPTLVSAVSGYVLNEARMLQPSGSLWLTSASGVGFWVLIGLLFSTARQGNGFAGLHDLWSGTRVVQRIKEPARHTAEPALDPTAAVETPSRRLGPFDVMGTLGATDHGTLLIGFDPRLGRRVWLHERASEAPPVAAFTRHLNRPGRLRWLTGRRTATEHWDAYEALDGVPLVRVLDRPRPWRDVRRWLADLARECDDGLKDGSLTHVAVDRVWITQDGRTKLLDFRAPGLRVGPLSLSPASTDAGQRFLSEVAKRALTGHAGGGSLTLGRSMRRALPLSATTLLDALDRGAIPTWAEVVYRTTGLMEGPDRVERWRRAASLALGVALPISMAVIVAVMSWLMMPPITRAITPEIEDLSHALNARSALRHVDSETDRAALEIYIAGRFGPTMTNPRLWTDPFTRTFLGRHRRLIERLVSDHPRVSADELASATRALGPWLARHASLRQRVSLRSINPWTTALGVAGILLITTAIVAIASAPVFRGGLLLRVFGIAVVTNNGEPVSRLRALWRGLVAWGLIVAPLWCAPLPPFWFVSPFGVEQGVSLAMGAWVTVLAGAVWAVAAPERGLQDRLSGTYLVPR